MRWRYIPKQRAKSRAHARECVARVQKRMTARPGDICPLEGWEPQKWWERSILPAVMAQYTDRTMRIVG